MALFFYLLACEDANARLCSSNHDRIHWIFDHHRVETIESLASENIWSVFETPPNHKRGYLHVRMYRIQTPNGSRLVKVIDEKFRLIMGERISDIDVFIHDTVGGMLLAERIGGPKVFRAGRIEDANGGRRFFVEMEEFFPQTETFTLKGKFNVHRSVDLTESKPAGSYLKQIAELFALAAEKKITPSVDIDFIFSPNEVRWIDTASWAHLPKDGWGERLAPVRFFERHYLRERELIDLFRADFFDRIEKSPLLSLEDKIEIRNGLGN